MKRRWESRIDPTVREAVDDEEEGVLRERTNHVGGFSCLFLNCSVMAHVLYFQGHVKGGRSTLICYGISGISTGTGAVEQKEAGRYIES